MTDREPEPLDSYVDDGREYAVEYSQSELVIGLLLMISEQLAVIIDQKVSQ